MKPLTNQEKFDRAAVGVLRQGKPSKSAHGACAYRVPVNVGTNTESFRIADGALACGIGHLISDDEFDDGLPLWNGRAARDLPSNVKERNGLCQDDRGEFETTLQVAHDLADSNSFRESFAEKMRGVAKEYYLSTAALDAAVAQYAALERLAVKQAATAPTGMKD